MRAAGAGPTEWVVVIPVKRLDRAKTRLSTRPAPQRGALALAFALDTVRAALACPRVAAVLVVTDDDTVGSRHRGHAPPDRGPSGPRRVEVTKINRPDFHQVAASHG